MLRKASRRAVCDALRRGTSYLQLRQLAPRLAVGIPQRQDYFSPSKRSERGASLALRSNDHGSLSGVSGIPERMAMVTSSKNWDLAECLQKKLVIDVIAR